MKRLPRYLVPKYFDLVLAVVHTHILDRVLALLSPFIRAQFAKGDRFPLHLALGSLQMFGAVRSAPLRYEVGTAEGRCAAIMRFYHSISVVVTNRYIFPPIFLLFFAMLHLICKITLIVAFFYFLLLLLVLLLVCLSSPQASCATGAVTHSSLCVDCC